jgi:hypothetical protein
MAIPPSAYEARQIAAIRRWQTKRSSMAGRIVGVAMKPVGWVAQRIVPAGAIEGALRGNMWLAEKWADSRGVLRDLQAESFDEVAQLDLERLDRAADSVRNWATAYGGAVGGVNGGVGLLAAPVGIPAIINIALRTIHKIGLCYGYAHADETEKLFVFEVLRLAGAMGPLEKATALLALRQLEVIIAKQSFKKMAENAAQNATGKEAFVIFIREFANGIGIQLTRNRLLMAVPLVGGGVGLLIDRNYIRSVGWAARCAYQERWLRERGKWPETDVPRHPSGPKRSAAARTIEVDRGRSANEDHS